MTRPGERLRAIAARVYSPRTMERLIDPVLADLQAEHAEARRRGTAWRSRLVLTAGYLAFLKVIALDGWERATRTMTAWSLDEHHVLARTITFSVLTIVAVTMLLQSPILLRASQWTSVSPLRLWPYLIPATLPFAVPVGLTLGLLFGWARPVISSHSRAAVLAIGLICSGVSFSTVAWIMPVTNQAFRVLVAGRDDVPKGVNELTLSELRQHINSELETPFLALANYSSHQFAIVYHARLALSCAPMILALFALSTFALRRGWRITLGVAVCGIYLSYYFAEPTADATLPATAIAWLPNLVVVVLSAILSIKAWRSSPQLPSRQQ